MDPRRARDPRLARADPRQRKHSGSPFNAPPPQQPSQYIPPHAANGAPPYLQQGPPPSYPPVPGPSYATPPPQLYPPQQYSSSPASNQQLRDEASAANSLPPPSVMARSTSQQSQRSNTPPNGYKARPLFCVVCASNQVCCTNCDASAANDPAWPTRIVQWRAITF